MTCAWATDIIEEQPEEEHKFDKSYELILLMINLRLVLYIRAEQSINL